MGISRILHFLFAVLVTIGLAIAPIASPAAAGNCMGDAEMQMAGMPCHMPCCPEKQKQNNCQDCPLCTICMLKVLQNGPSANGLPIHQAQWRIVRPLNEPKAVGLTRAPPDQPPRTIV